MKKPDQEKEARGDIPVACALTDAELARRKNTLLAGVRARVVETRETEAGYAFCFEYDADTLDLLGDVIRLESECCPFLEFGLRVAAGRGPVWLEVSGAGDAKAAVRSLLIEG